MIIIGLTISAGSNNFAITDKKPHLVYADLFSNGLTSKKNESFLSSIECLAFSYFGIQENLVSLCLKDNPVEVLLEYVGDWRSIFVRRMLGIPEQKLAHFVQILQWICSGSWVSAKASSTYISWRRILAAFGWASCTTSASFLTVRIAWYSAQFILNVTVYSSKSSIASSLVFLKRILWNRV